MARQGFEMTGCYPMQSYIGSEFLVDAEFLAVLETSVFTGEWSDKVNVVHRFN